MATTRISPWKPPNLTGQKLGEMLFCLDIIHSLLNKMMELDPSKKVEIENAIIACQTLICYYDPEEWGCLNRSGKIRTDNPSMESCAASLLLFTKFIWHPRGIAKGMLPHTITARNLAPIERLAYKTLFENCY